jgi:hypothetical protein
MVFGRPIFVEKYTGVAGGGPPEEGKMVPKPPQAQVDALHAVYVQQFRELFEKYKKVCRSPNGDLIIV